MVIVPTVMSAAPVAADNVNYTGSGTLQTVPAPNWFWDGVIKDSLFPGTGTTPLSSDNSVTVNYTAGSGTDPVHVFGGLSKLEGASGNEVTLLDGKVNRDIYGGYSQSGDVTDNTATINGGSVGRHLVGGKSDSGNVTGNTVTINDGYVGSRVHGGESSDGDVTNNSVTLISGDTGGSIYGGISRNGEATRNTITISGGSVAASVTGGYSDFADVDYNSVTISGGSVGSRVYGGSTYSTGNTTHNTVTISGGSFGSYHSVGGIYGGAGVGDATYNKVIISGGAMYNYEVIGGSSQKGDAENNSVEISGANATYTHIYGGLSGTGDAAYNTIVFSDGEVSEDIIGGISGGNVTKNEVTISGGKVAGDILGGYSTKGDATYNTINMSGATVTNLYGGYSRGLSGSGDAAYNTIVFSGGEVVEDIYGGVSISGSSKNNEITISGGKVGGDIVGGYSALDAIHNVVTISGGEVSKDIYGGASIGGSATNNEITISGGKVGGDIVGGYSANLDAIHNVVTISGSPTLTTAGIYGGFTGSGTADAFTGNTLNFKSSGISAAGVGNFQYYNFYLPDGTAANDTMLSVTDAVDLTGATAELYLQGAISLQDGDKVSLINSAAGVSNYSASNSQVTSGAFTTYDFSIYSDANDLWAELISGAIITQQSNILTDSRLAPLAFLSQGADLVASLEYLEVSGDKRFNTFAIAGGGSSTYDTGAGAEVDVDGFSMLAGVMWNAPVNKNSLIVSAFFEAGWGSYDTYRDFGADGVVRGSGDSDYYGGGLHMRYKWDSGRPGGLYAEGSLRFGRNKSDFHTNDLSTVSDFSYDSSSNYFGAHVGLGYVWQLSGKTRLEAMSKYLWTRLGSDEVTASSGDRISFDSLNSSRWRTGFRMYHDYGNANAVTLYYGAMYEYEFGGDAGGRLGGLGLDGISLSGGSGIGELGVIFRPSKDNDRLTMQLGVQGYVGAREGVSGTLKLQYAF